MNVKNSVVTTAKCVKIEKLELLGRMKWEIGILLMNRDSTQRKMNVEHVVVWALVSGKRRKSSVLLERKLEKKKKRNAKHGVKKK